MSEPATRAEGTSTIARRLPEVVAARALPHAAAPREDDLPDTIPELLARLADGLELEEGGEIGVDAVPGRGSASWFTLPLDPEGAA